MKKWLNKVWQWIQNLFRKKQNNTASGEAQLGDDMAYGIQVGSTIITKFTHSKTNVYGLSNGINELDLDKLYKQFNYTKYTSASVITLNISDYLYFVKPITSASTSTIHFGNVSANSATVKLTNCELYGYSPLGNSGTYGIRVSNKVLEQNTTIMNNPTQYAVSVKYSLKNDDTDDYSILCTVPLPTTQLCINDLVNNIFLQMVKRNGTSFNFGYDASLNFKESPISLIANSLPFGVSRFTAGVRTL